MSSEDPPKLHLRQKRLFEFLGCPAANAKFKEDDKKQLKEKQQESRKRKRLTEDGY